jgi:glycolate oxidase FAD binding subunit
LKERTVVLPSSTEEAAEALRSAAERNLTVLPRGAGTGWATPSGDVIVDMRKMDQVIEHAAGDLVARVQAGATMGQVAEVLAAPGQRLALDVPPEVTVGGMIATGTAGPLRFRYGSPRDLLIGITVVRPDGVVAHSGGKVVKNVAGYDLGKLFAGSRGTLGLITEATFRLHPLPQAVAYLQVHTTGAAAAAAAVVTAANSPLQPAAVELDGDSTVGVLLEGSTAGVAERAKHMTGLLGTADVRDTPPPWWGRLPEPPGAVIRVSFWLSQLRDVLDAIARSGADCTVRGSAGAGLLYVCPGNANVGGLVAMLRTAVADRGGVAVLTEPAIPTDPLMRAVRDQFDPDHRMGGGA